MNPDFSDELISAYLDGELTASEQLVVEQMLIDNPEARRLFEELRTLHAGLQSLPKNRLDEGFVSRVLNAAERGMLKSRTDESLVQSPAVLPVVPEKRQPNKRQPDSIVQLRRWQRRFWLMSTLAAALLIALSFNYAWQDRRDLAQSRSESPPTDSPGGDAWSARSMDSSSDNLVDHGGGLAGENRKTMTRAFSFDQNSGSLESERLRGTNGSTEVPAPMAGSPSPAGQASAMLAENVANDKKFAESAPFGIGPGRGVPGSLHGDVATDSAAADSAADSAVMNLAAMQADRPGTNALALDDSFGNGTTVVRFNIESNPESRSDSAGVVSLLSLLPDQTAMGRSLGRGEAGELQIVGESEKETDFQDRSQALHTSNVPPQPEMIVLEGTREQVWATLEKMASDPQVVSAQLWNEDSQAAQAFSKEFKQAELAQESFSQSSKAKLSDGQSPDDHVQLENADPSRGVTGGGGGGGPGGGGGLGGGLGAGGKLGGTGRRYAGERDAGERDAAQVGRESGSGRPEGSAGHGGKESVAKTYKSRPKVDESKKVPDQDESPDELKASADSDDKHDSSRPRRHSTQERFDSVAAHIGRQNVDENTAESLSAGNVRWRKLVANPLFDFSYRALGDQELFSGRAKLSKDELPESPLRAMRVRAAETVPHAPKSNSEVTAGAVQTGASSDIVRVIVFFQAVERQHPGLKADVQPESPAKPAIEPEK